MIGFGRSLGLAAVTVAAIMLAGFGTVHSLGQDAEHERITRHALSCQYEDAKAYFSGACFEPASMQALAGGRLDFGAVGAPDRGTLIFQPKAHCDRGDYLPLAGYPNTAEAARGALEACRAWMKLNLDLAVDAAGGLLDGQGRLRPGQLATSCIFVGGVPGRAKCNVLEKLGYLLHASEDFYAHTNWADTPDPARPIGLTNPLGLGQHGPAPWIALRGDEPFPDGLISGCFESEPESRHCPGHVKHADLNKDTGVIDGPFGIGAGTSPRGRVGDNFRWAVEDAVADTRDKWAVFHAALEARYGAARAELMACAVRTDDPFRAC